LKDVETHYLYDLYGVDSLVELLRRRTNRRDDMQGASDDASRREGEAEGKVVFTGVARNFDWEGPKLEKIVT